MGLGQRRGLSQCPAHLRYIVRSPHVRISLGLIGHPVFLPDPPRRRRRRPPRCRKMANSAAAPSSSILFASSFLLLVVVSSAYRPGDIVPISRMGQYHSVRDLSTPASSFLFDRFRLRLLIFPVLDFCLIGWVDGFSVQDCLARCGRPPLPDVCC